MGRLPAADRTGKTALARARAARAAGLIDRVLRADEDKEDQAKLDAFHAEMAAVKAEVHALTKRFPLY